MSIQDRVNQIEEHALFVTPVDIGMWRLNRGSRRVSDGVVIAPSDLAWLLAIARNVSAPAETVEP